MLRICKQEKFFNAQSSCVSTNFVHDCSSSKILLALYTHGARVHNILRVPVCAAHLGGLLARNSVN